MKTEVTVYITPGESRELHEFSWMLSPFASTLNRPNTTRYNNAFETEHHIVHVVAHNSFLSPDILGWHSPSDTATLLIGLGRIAYDECELHNADRNLAKHLHSAKDGLYRG